MHRWLRVLGVLSSVLFTVALTAPALAASAPTLLQTITVPGTPGRWDLLQVDPGTHHLFLSASSNGTLDVLDLNTGTFIAQIPGLPLSVSKTGSYSGSNGLAVAANVGKVFVSDQVDNAVHVYDIASNTQTDVIPTTQKGSDSVAYDATDKKVYVANGDSQTMTVIDATNDTIVTQITLPGGPELALWDPFDDTIHQNLAAKNQQAVIDPKTDTIKYLFNMPPGCTPKGAAIDPTDQHIIIGCGGAMTVIMDGGNGAILSVSSNVGGSDAVAFNSVDGRFYTASSGNKVAGKATPVMGVFDAATNAWVASAPTDTSAHTLAVDPVTGRIYLASQKTGTLLVFAAGASVTQLP